MLAGKMIDAFDAIAFTGRSAALPRLERIVQDGPEAIVGLLSDALAQAASPDTLLLRLDRYLDACINPGAELEQMARYPRYFALATTVFDQSHFLTDIVCRNPEYLPWAWSEGNLDETPPRESLRAELFQQLAAFDDFAAQCESMRRFRRREILRIACRDVFAHASLAAVALDLSNLADAALEAAMHFGQADLERRFGKPMHAEGSRAGPGASMVVIAMGKLGGRELNFSSDIDPILVYSEEGDTSGGEGGSISNHQYFVKLGERLVKALSDMTPEGNVFRVDMRLRPHGAKGPLAMNLESTLDYYAHAGQTWERQALIKARPCAGDMGLGARFLEGIRPFAFPRYFDDDMLEDVRRLKQQMEAQVAARGETALEVKLGRGGIRDIEFTVQMLQMLNGGRMPELRTTNTLEAIRLLGERGRLTPFEAQTLTSNYVFLRQVEHRLQIEGSQQVHCIPADAAARGNFARRFGYESGEAFMHEYQDRAEETRKILERFLQTEGGGNLWMADILNPRSDARASLPRLAELGFDPPDHARAILLSLYTGAPERPHSLHVQRRFAEIAPDLVKAISDCPDPSGTLDRFADMLEKQGAMGPIFEMLKYNTGLIGHFAKLLSNSEHLTRILMRDPGLFDTIGDAEGLRAPATMDSMRALLASLRRAYDPDAGLYRLRDGELLRIGMRELFGDADILDISRELSNLAEVILQDVTGAALARAAEKFGPARARFCVLALGKFAGHEMGYGSDLDVVFVFEDDQPVADGMAPAEYFTFAATRIVNTLGAHTRYGQPLYEIDTRLRPYGKEGSLVVGHERLYEYYREEAESWEHLALVKVRAVAGDAAFGREVEEAARAIAFAQSLTEDALARIDDIRRQHAASATRYDLKKHEGGIAELEFGLRLLQVKHAAEHPELMRGDVAGALEALQQAGAIATDEAERLQQAYRLYRRVENRIRMFQGRPESSLPEDDAARADLARRLGLDGELMEHIEAARGQVHAFYQRAFAEAGGSSG